MLQSRGASDALESVVQSARACGIKNWACQFQGQNGGDLQPAGIGACSTDLIIIDYAADGSAAGAFNAAAVEVMRQRPEGGIKKLIAYMSIGEAEVGRFYWNQAWTKQKKKMKAAPAWLHAPNAWGWQGNWTVKFWDPEWQKIIVDAPDSYLNRIISAGFDGVFLDLVEVAEFWEDDDRGPHRNSHALDDMVSFVEKIAKHARCTRGRSNFLVIPNGSILLESNRYRSAISAVVVEDVIYDQGAQAEETPALVKRPSTGAGSTAEIAANLRPGLRDSIPILAMDYLMDHPEDRAKIPETAAAMAAIDTHLIPYFTVRKLDQLCLPFSRETS